jgi:putative acyl-CoA dehydrogenase
VIALDVLRAMGRSSDTLAAVTAEIELARGADRRFDEAVKRLHAELGETDGLAFRARRIAGLLVLCLQGSLLLRHSPAAVAEAFCASRLGGDWGAVLGTLPVGTAADKIVERASVPPV